MKRRLFPPLFISLLALSLAYSGTAQSGPGHTVFGDFRVDDSKVSGLKPISFDVLLYALNGRVVGRQTIANYGRYRFTDLRNGEYFVVVQMENTEVARVRAVVQAAVSTDFRHDISLEWRPNHSTKKDAKAEVISATNQYARSTANDLLFKKAEEAVKKRAYSDAIQLLNGIVGSDPKDFEAWTELGTVYFLKKENHEAEKAYLLALDQQPSFVLALLNLGKLRLAQKNNEGAVEALTKAVALPSPSAEANYFLGEAYLGMRKGSKAVHYMNEAIRIDPTGKAEIHLRIAAIYDVVGLKDLAAAEYEKFLEKRSDYPDKKKLQRYIAQNKKQ